ncbi:phosphotransferase family protein [Amycolatopsis acidiphila]|uniref:phosphotransferase family protein n=1 Tax=Amycolatopsis acidiphila TaxID=715473 RepID=UPI0019869AEF|nr:phosphotransferase family protein [Amycolatopsis acidiphila]UIJ63238.1 phosphotransferase family protein [Amycolatopsis acidiphila]GHG74535.1 putative phosphotransferase [Amycolatopsis acidiphila]
MSTDSTVTREVLARWLARQGCRDVRLGELTQPDAGYSGRTVFVAASWAEPGGTARHEELVVRVQSPDQQLFVAPDAVRQAETMRGLAGEPGVPVPRIWFTESDPAVLGAPFYVMGRVRGRVPGDVPSWHVRGWTVELSPGQRTRLHDNGLAALVALHRVDWRRELGFLDPAGTGTALERYLAQLENWYAWCGPSRRFGPEVLAAGLAHVLEHRPDDDGEVVVWGDARPGNICFADDLSVAALFDWETATIGPPGIDLGWWLMFERYLCEAQGKRRLDGVPGRAGTIARYHELGGVKIPDIDYYELLAGVVMTLIASRLADVLVETGRVTPEIAAIYPNRAVGLVGESLARIHAG